MSDQSSMRDDISYMRDLADRGRTGPIYGGAFLASSGLIYGVALFVPWAAQAGVLPLSFEFGPAYWLGVSTVWALVCFALFLGIRRHAGGIRNVASFAFGMSWAGAGIGITTSCAAIAVASLGGHAPEVAWTICISIVMAFYGTAWFVSGALARRRWMYVAAFAAYVFSVVLAAINIYDPRRVLVIAAALIVTIALPGLKLMAEKAS